MANTTSVANVVLLRLAPGHGTSPDAMCIANVHLFGHPRAPHIGLLQAALTLRACERLIAQHTDLDCSLVFCGDLNCGTYSGVAELLSVGCVAPSHQNWVEGASFQWGKGSDTASVVAAMAARAKFMEPDAWIPAIPLSHAFDLSNSSSCAMQFSYVNEHCMVHLCDHIFHDSTRLRVARALPSPPFEMVCQWGVPSAMFPSDHVAVVVDLLFNARSTCRHDEEGTS